MVNKFTQQAAQIHNHDVYTFAIGRKYLELKVKIETQLYEKFESFLGERK